MNTDIITPSSSIIEGLATPFDPRTAHAARKQENNIMQQIEEAVAFVRTKLGADTAPTIAIVLGSGLGDLAKEITDATIIPYSQIPHFQTSTVEGHAGNLIIGTLGGKRIIAMQGRLHYYEGYTMQQVTFPIRVMARLGVKTLLLSNAAGGITPKLNLGDLMVITDHINLLPNPLIGPNLDNFGPRFPDMTCAYSKKMHDIALQQAADMHLELKEGVYIGVTGPTFETTAEYRMMERMGADAVGMSTVPEVIVAQHCGIEVFGLSIITDVAQKDVNIHVCDHKDVVEQANRATIKTSELFKRIIATL